MCGTYKDPWSVGDLWEMWDLSEVVKLLEMDEIYRRLD